MLISHTINMLTLFHRIATSILFLFFITLSTAQARIDTHCNYFIKNHIPSTGTYYLTGMILELPNKTKVYSYGTIFDTHTLLYENALQHYGKISKVIWAGEMETKDGFVSAVNETAGFMVRKKESAEALNLEYKGSDSEKVRQFFNEHLALKIFIKTQTHFLEFDPNNMHFAKDLYNLADMRHDFGAPIRMIKSFSELRDRGKYDDEKIKSLYLQIFKPQGETLLKFADLFEKYHYNNFNEDGSILIGAVEIQKLKEIGASITDHGLSLDKAIRDAQIKFLSTFLKAFDQGSGQTGLVTLEVKPNH